MDFVYAPPPPPPPRKSSSNNSNTSDKRGNLDKRSHNVKNRFQNDTASEGKANKILGDLNDLGDLPTYLPNSSNYSNEFDSKEDSENEEADLIHNESEGQNKSNEPVFIPGTNITLETEEDIRKWIEERKKKWPSRRNIEEKEKIRQEQTKIPSNSKKRMNESSVSQNTKKPKNICKFYQNNKRCKFGNKCKNVHEATTSSGAKASQNTKTINNILVAIPQRFKNELYINEKDTNAHPLLFKMLVQKEHFENENSKILEFLEFLDERGLIDHDVEI
mmetsp:Transcript_2299/g.2530  ORF Transcript_2299/g.2530 Transcript_2299/m.2530 type:complete len:276 (+) Transcript_2299:270-1097(+)